MQRFVWAPRATSTDRNRVPVIASRTVAGTGTASVISDPSTGQALDLQTTDGTTSMWILDGTGSPAAAIADTGKTAYTVSYDPYGTESITTDSAASAQWQQNPYGFKAGLRSSDANGLTKFGYRWQTSGTGGWLQRDTLGAPLSPTNANRYAYAGDDPVNSMDASGRWTPSWEGFGKFAGYYGYAGTAYNLTTAAATGNSKEFATAAVGAVVGTIAGLTCEGIVVGGAAGAGAVPGALGCAAVAGLVSAGVTGGL